MAIQRVGTTLRWLVVPIPAEVGCPFRGPRRCSSDHWIPWSAIMIPIALEEMLGISNQLICVLRQLEYQ